MYQFIEMNPPVNIEKLLCKESIDNIHLKQPKSLIELCKLRVLNIPKLRDNLSPIEKHLFNISKDYKVTVVTKERFNTCDECYDYYYTRYVPSHLFYAKNVDPSLFKTRFQLSNIHRDCSCTLRATDIYINQLLDFSPWLDIEGIIPF